VECLTGRRIESKFQVNGAGCRNHTFMTFENMLKEIGLTAETSDNIILKMDVEQFEWPIFDSWRVDMVLPHQIMVELHYDETVQGFRTMDSSEIALKIAHLYKLGYRIANREDNNSISARGRCTEVVLLRYLC